MDSRADMRTYLGDRLIDVRKTIRLGPVGVEKDQARNDLRIVRYELAHSQRIQHPLQLSAAPDNDLAGPRRFGTVL